MSNTVCEKKTYELVYKKHYKDLYRFMYYKYSDPDKASDDVQESFIKLWTNCTKVPLDKVKSFLFTVANNLFLNNMAHQKVKFNFERLPQKNYDNESPDYKLEEKEFEDKLEQAISDLEEQQRIVFTLSRIEKKKYSEIAEILGISIKTVEKKMGKALKQLRVHIELI